MIFLFWLSIAVGRAQEVEPDDPLSEHTVGGAAVDGGAGADLLETSAGAAREDAVAAFPRVESAVAAAALGTDVERIDATRAAVELIYERRYRDARQLLGTLAIRYPTSGIGPVGLAIIYQGLMFENFDFRYERQYRAASDAARAQLALGEKEPKNAAFATFLGAALSGLDAILALRKGEYFSALERAISGMRGLDRTRTLAPDFHDALLGDGMYLYWRSVVTRSSKLLPNFPDKRAEGLALMRRAERESVLLGPAASLALVYSHIEERDLRSALDRSLALRTRYAKNVVNNLTLGRLYTSLRRYPDALRAYDDVARDDPDNQRVYYFRGLVLARTGRTEDARVAYSTYIGFAEVPPPLRSQAWYRLGTVYEAQHDLRQAEAAYRHATSEAPNEAARRALDRLRRK